MLKKSRSTDNKATSQLATTSQILLAKVRLLQLEYTNLTIEKGFRKKEIQARTRLVAKYKSLQSFVSLKTRFEEILQTLQKTEGCLGAWRDFVKAIGADAMIVLDRVQELHQGFLKTLESQRDRLEIAGGNIHVDEVELEKSIEKLARHFGELQRVLEGRRDINVDINQKPEHRCVEGRHRQNSLAIVAESLSLAYQELTQHHTVLSQLYESNRENCGLINQRADELMEKLYSEFKDCEIYTTKNT